jgi:hypothetical protein
MTTTATALTFGQWVKENASTYPQLYAWLLEWSSTTGVQLQQWSPKAVYLLLFSISKSREHLYEQLSAAIDAFDGSFLVLEEQYLTHDELFDAGIQHHLPFLGYTFKGDHKYLPKSSMDFVIPRDSWVSSDASYYPPEPPTPNHRHWFTVLSDASGFNLPVWYPLDPEPGADITVYVGDEPIDWTHGAEGLTVHEIAPLVHTWVTELGAGELWVNELHEEAVAQ